MAGETVRVMDLKRGEGSVSGGRRAWCERLVWRSPQCWCASRRGSWAVALAGGEWQENTFNDWQCAREIVEGVEESASSPAFLAVSERQSNTVWPLQRAETARRGAPVCVSCLDDHHPWVLLVKTVALFVVCIFPSVALNSEPGQQQPHEELDEHASLLLRLEASAKRLAGGSPSAGPSNVDHDEAETLFSCFVPGRAVSLTDELLIMYASRRPCGSCTCCFQGSHGKGQRATEIAV